jgi:proteic killer suppression protein
LNPEHVDKSARVLALLNRAARPQDMNLPGFRLHPLKGGLAGFWSVTISANWRIIFRFDDGDVTDVDLIDYH